jgi:hypothetical protein
MTERDFLVPLRGARGSAARFLVTTLALGPPPRDVGVPLNTGEGVLGERWPSGTSRYPYGGPAEALPVFRS